MSDLNTLVASADRLLVKMADELTEDGSAAAQSVSDAPEDGGGIFNGIRDALAGAAESVADTAKGAYGRIINNTAEGINAAKGAVGSAADTAKGAYNGAVDLEAKGVNELKAEIENLKGQLAGLGEKASPYVPTALLGAGGAGLIHELLSKEKEKGIMDYLPWLLLGGAGGYGMYNQFSGK